jgi:hypothetical protein
MAGSLAKSKWFLDKAPSRMVLKMFVGALKKKKDATEDEKRMAEMISSSYDISDIKYIEPIVEYIESGK